MFSKTALFALAVSFFSFHPQPLGQLVRRAHQTPPSQRPGRRGPAYLDESPPSREVTGGCVGDRGERSPADDKSVQVVCPECQDLNVSRMVAK
ncbi:hypothetical protein C8F01DRAFT_290592 [Mycena amicta]|nr:hypothetical protein C8F01DRAFT_290592 [Mycena amicta]